MNKDFISINLAGRVLIKDALTGETILNKSNAVHPQNMALAIARSMSRDANGSIYLLGFGNGGTYINSGGQIVYNTPNTIGAATLYNQTYNVQVDEQSVGTPVTNSVLSSAAPSPSISSIITVTAQLNASVPSGQAVGDNITTNPNAPYMFDEVGLFTQDNLLLSHLIFSPIEKTANRAFLITYTLTATVS